VHDVERQCVDREIAPTQIGFERITPLHSGFARMVDVLLGSKGGDFGPQPVGTKHAANSAE